MKKIICLLLVFSMSMLLFAGCGKFDIENEDLTAYVTLGDIESFSYDEMAARYEAYRESLRETTTSFYPTTGYTLDFYIKAELLGEGESTIIDAWTFDTEGNYVKNYDLFRYAKNERFDTGICYDVTDVDATLTATRPVKVNETFYFTMTFDRDVEGILSAGDTVQFAVSVVSALPAVYPDTYIADRLQAFYLAAEKPVKETAELGDTLSIDYLGKVDGVAFEGGTANGVSMILGSAGYIDGFEDDIVGHKNGETFDITVTFPENYEESLAGKEAVFTITINSIYSDDTIIQANTSFETMWDLKYYFRVDSFILFALMDVVYDRCELIAYPEKLLASLEKQYAKYIKRHILEQVDAYAQYGITYSQAEMREMLFPDGSDKTYIEEASRDAAFDYMVATLVAKELGVVYSDEQYQADLERLAAEYTEYYEVEYTPANIEDIYGEEIMRLSFIETMITDVLYERISDRPSVPESTSQE